MKVFLITVKYGIKGKGGCSLPKLFTPVYYAEMRGNSVDRIDFCVCWTTTG